MSFTFTQANSAAASTTVTLNGVAAGSLIVIWCKWEGNAGNGNCTVSDGTSSFTMGTARHHSNNDVHGQFGYLLSANSGNKTFTCTFPSGSTFTGLVVFEFAVVGAPSFDTQIGQGSDGQTSATSGNLTTTGADELVLGGFSPYQGGSTTAMQINGLAAMGSATVDGQISSWYRSFASTFTGAATCNPGYSGSFAYVCCAIAFKATATTPTVTGSASGVRQTQITAEGNVTSDGGATVTERGFCWGSSANPDTSGTHQSVSGTTGAYFYAITGLSPSATLHVRSYATNSQGTSYGPDVTVATIDAFDGALNLERLQCSAGDENDLYRGCLGWNSQAIADDFFDLTAAGASIGGAQTYSAYTQSASAQPIATATGSQAEGLESNSASAAPTATAAGAQTYSLESQSAELAAVDVISITAAQTYPAYSQSPQVSPVATATGAQSQGEAVQSAQVSSVAGITAAQSEYAETQSAQAAQIVAITGSQTENAYTQDAQLVLISALSADQSLPQYEQAASVNTSLPVSAAQTYPEEIQEASIQGVTLTAELIVEQTYSGYSQASTIAPVGVISAAQTYDAYVQTVGTGSALIAVAQVYPPYTQTAYVAFAALGGMLVRGYFTAAPTRVRFSATPPVVEVPARPVHETWKGFPVQPFEANPIRRQIG